MRVLWVVVLVLGCGRLRFDEVEGDDTSSLITVEAPCTEPAMQAIAYACMPVASNVSPGATVTWSIGPANACPWLSVDSETGKLTGTPARQDVGHCNGEVVATSSLDGSATGTFAIDIAHLRVMQVENGAYHTCALSKIGTVRCWGNNASGELGYNDSVSVSTGVAGREIETLGDVPVGGKVLQISVAYMESCALLEGGGVRCWGAGSFSRLGYEHTNDVGDGGVGGSIITNGDVPLGGPAKKVVVGGNGGCAIMEAGGVRCWGLWHGHDNAAQLRGVALAAAGDVPLGFDPIDIAGGYGHFCALSAAGAVRCWGFNGNGELGYNDGSNVGDGTANHSILQMGDVPVGGPVKQISAGDMTTCALLVSGAVRCWGANQYGQLGYNDKLPIGDGSRSIAAAGDVPIGASATWIGAGEEHTCAVIDGGAVRCWGLNLEGQLGYNDTTPVGDGGAGRRIVDMGNVAVGAPVARVYTTDWDTGHTCALLESGALRCWGNNGSGQLGRNTTLNIGNGGPGGTISAAGDLHPF